MCFRFFTAKDKLQPRHARFDLTLDALECRLVLKLLDGIQRVGELRPLDHPVADGDADRAVFGRAPGQANITTVDYDPGTTEVNQLNRIKLMMAVAMRNQADKP